MLNIAKWVGRGVALALLCHVSGLYHHAGRYRTLEAFR